MQPLRIDTAQPVCFRDAAFAAAPAQSAESGLTIQPSEITLLSTLGEGSGGVVFKARYNGALVAAKMLLGGGDSLQFEHRLLRHPNLINMYGTSSHVSGPVLVMEYVSGGNLRGWMEANIVPHPTAKLGNILAARVARASSLALQIANGMACLHSNRIVHRDLKPENVLLQRVDEDEFTVKIADFGLSREVDVMTGAAMTVTNGVKGTPVYMSPEQWRRGAVSDKTDVYAYGLMLLEMFTGEEIQWQNCPAEFRNPVARDANRHKFYKWLRKNARPIVPEPSECFPAHIHAVVTSCLAHVPEARPSFHDIIAAMNACPVTVAGVIEEAEAAPTMHITTNPVMPSSPVKEDTVPRIVVTAPAGSSPAHIASAAAVAAVAPKVLSVAIPTTPVDSNPTPFSCASTPSTPASQNSESTTNPAAPAGGSPPAHHIPSRKQHMHNNMYHQPHACKLDRVDVGFVLAPYVPAVADCDM